ncbi:Protein-L-isoaspartate O-methyltransferase [Chlorella vulgaris]
MARPEQVEAFHMDSDEEEAAEMTDDEEVPLGRVRQAANLNRLPLHHFLRLIAGGRMMEHGAAATNEDLVQNLKRGGVIQSERVHRALQLCARDLFVPAEHREEALLDAPIRVESLDFNISAPHMHATCLEALQLQPGHKASGCDFLDVGSGCGVLTACGAWLVGPLGAAVGFDVRREAVSMGRDNVRRLTADSAEFASGACPPRIELQNVFMPSPRWLAHFDRVHVGASCPPDRLGPLLSLLRPEGGLIVVPVAPNDLRVITKKANGAITQKVISQVRFSDLEVPTDAEVLLATLRSERRQRTAPGHQPSTFAQDVAAIVGGTPPPSPTLNGNACASSFIPSSSPSTGTRLPFWGAMWRAVPASVLPLLLPVVPARPIVVSQVIDGLPATPQASAGDKSWPHRLSKLFSSCSSGSAASGECLMEGEGAGSEGAPGSAPASPPPLRLSSDELGEPDCVLEGQGWSIPVHRAVLRQRCDHFRARCGAGWADADSAKVLVPDHFSRQAVASFLHYCYNDSLEQCSDPQEAVAVLHVALFYACPRLIHLCELRLAHLLRGRDRRGGGKQPRGGGAVESDEDGLADAAAALLALADEAGLSHLRAVALDYIVHHYEAVAATESYQGLSRGQVALVAQEACRSHTHMVAHIRKMADEQPLPEPLY